MSTICWTRRSESAAMSTTRCGESFGEHGRVAAREGRDGLVAQWRDLGMRGASVCEAVSPVEQRLREQQRRPCQFVQPSRRGVVLGCRVVLAGRRGEHAEVVMTARMRNRTVAEGVGTGKQRVVERR